ncbi:MAG: dihydroorotase [Bacteroidales bacterium]
MKSKTILIKDGIIVNEGVVVEGSILLSAGIIEKIFISGEKLPKVDRVVDVTGKLVFPGVIDDQVHFREPGNEEKGTIASESAAAVLGGVTSYMEMPNTKPATISLKEVKGKEEIASKNSYANYSFFLGATNDNLKELKKADPKQICGIKLFMGSSTGNMLVDNPQALEAIFKECKLPIAAHCESEEIIRSNLIAVKERYRGEDIPFREHPNIRSREACIASTQKAIALATKYNSNLHILHVSTKEEVELIREAKRDNPAISGEICLHYLLFDSSMYDRMGAQIKCNPAIKDRSDRDALIAALKEGAIDIVATDHAPHTLEEKRGSYFNAPSGLPMVQHGLQIMLELHKEGFFTLDEVVYLMSHAPANRFKIDRRGFIREGYWGDIVVVDTTRADYSSTLFPAYKCGWSPLAGKEFSNSIIHTFVNGVEVVANGKLSGVRSAQKLLFNR